jgi:hypothetical protein
MNIKKQQIDDWLVGWDKHNKGEMAKVIIISILLNVF